MDANSQSELNDIINELASIINELDSVSSEIRSNFMNIGTDKCADAIDIVNANYRNVLQKLYNIDTTDVIDGYNTYN